MLQKIEKGCLQKIAAPALQLYVNAKTIGLIMIISGWGIVC